MMNAHSAAYPSEQRTGIDRRTKPTSYWSVLRLRGRRKGFRRAGEGHNGFVDRPTSYVAALVLWVTMCSALDAFLTLLYLAHGGGEANPFMALALTYGNTAFVSLKMGVTCTGAWSLAVLQQFLPAYVALHSLSLMYVIVLGIHATIWVP